MEEKVQVYDIPDLRLDKTPRPQQEEMLNFVIESIKSNNKYCLLDSPTGLGKSYFSVMFMDWYRTKYNMKSSFDVLTNSKILQEQYTNDYDFMNSLWGKGSYYCEKYDTSCDIGMEMCGLNNDVCENCPYKEAKWKFDNGNIGLANYHLFLTYHILVPNAWKRESNVLIIDEADSFEDIFVDFITTELNKYVFRANGFDIDESEKMMSVFNEYMQLDEFIEKIENVVLPYSNTVLSKLNDDFKETNDVKVLEKMQTLSRTITKWELLIEQYNALPDNWILDSESKKTYTLDGKQKDEYLTFSAQPVWAYPYLDKYIWSKYEHVIFMSGTILNKDLFCNMNGLDINVTSYMSLNSPFEIKNRPIYYFENAGKQTYSTKDITWKNQKQILEKIIHKHRKQKGIIHTANYEIQRWVNNDFGNTKRILTHETEDRNKVLEHHYTSDEPTILVSPSMDIGVDLKDDYSRFQVILKMPYPYLGSKKVKKRMETMPEYYGLTTVRKLVQSYGRSIRSYDDFADTYIIDSSFGTLLYMNRQYFPEWFLNAIKYVN